MTSPELEKNNSAELHPEVEPPMSLSLSDKENQLLNSLYDEHYSPFFVSLDERLNSSDIMKKFYVELSYREDKVDSAIYDIIKHAGLNDLTYRDVELAVFQYRRRLNHEKKVKELAGKRAVDGTFSWLYDPSVSPPEPDFIGVSYSDLSK